MKLSHLPGSGFAYFAVVASVFVTALYSFRMYFMVFHGEGALPRSGSIRDSPMGAEAAARSRPWRNDRSTRHGHDDHGHAHEPHETPWVVWLPLVLLAIPSVVIGAIAIGPMLFGDFFAHGAGVREGDLHRRKSSGAARNGRRVPRLGGDGAAFGRGPAGVARARGCARRVVPVSWSSRTAG